MKCFPFIRSVRQFRSEIWRQGKNFEEHYDKLLLSPGARPVQPEIPGVGLENLFTLRTVEDTMRIKAYIETHQPKSVVLAGGGFIGWS